MTPARRKHVARAAQRAREVKPPNPIERRMSKFLHEPPTMRTAASVIVTATATVVVVSGIAMRLIDHTQYKNVWVGMWWAIQTVTTVGYGDVTPTKASGRILATFVMLEGIAFIAITTALITSSFVARAEMEQGLGQPEPGAGEVEEIQAGFAELARRLDQIEAMLRRAAADTDRPDSSRLPRRPSRA
jgi:voltage-gated potassium channel